MKTTERMTRKLLEHRSLMASNPLMDVADQYRRENLPRFATALESLLSFAIDQECDTIRISQGSISDDYHDEKCRRCKALTVAARALL